MQLIHRAQPNVTMSNIYTNHPQQPQLVISRNCEEMNRSTDFITQEGEHYTQLDVFMRMLDAKCNELKGLIDVNIQMNNQTQCEIDSISNAIQSIWKRVNDLEDATYNTLPEHMICSDLKIPQLLNITDELITDQGTRGVYDASWYSLDGVDEVRTIAHT